MERTFTLGDITGVLWTSAVGSDRAPLVLLGHGGGQHKRAPGVVAHWRHRAVPEWQTTMDALQDAVGLSAGPIGYLGLSLGTAIGVRLVAAESRISAAVFGVIGAETLIDAARAVTVPVEFLLQWNDELVERESGLALFDAFGSSEKTLHANPGGHVDVPRFEVDSSVRFFARHLAEVGTQRWGRRYVQSSWTGSGLLAGSSRSGRLSLDLRLTLSKALLI